SDLLVYRGTLQPKLWVVQSVMVLFFFGVHPAVGLCQKLLGIGSVVWRECMAHAQREQIIAADFAAGFFGESTHSLLLLLEGFRFESGKNQDELIAAHARHVVVLAKRVFRLGRKAA